MIHKTLLKRNKIQFINPIVNFVILVNDRKDIRI